MNILILGGAGFIGSNLVRHILSQDRHTITVVDSLDPKLKSTTDHLKSVIKRIQFIQGDIRDAALMQQVVIGKEVIFNCAAQTSHPLSLTDPLYDAQVNCLGSLTVLESVRNRNPKALVVYTSSSTVVGKSQADIVDESHGEHPLDIYSANKGVVEKYHWIYHHVHGLKTLSIRFANLFGPYGKGYPEFGFINYFIALAQQDKQIKIFGEGLQKRNVMYVQDAVDLLYRCASHPHIFGGIYFAAHREHYSVMEIATQIVSVFDRGKIVHVPWPDLRKKIEIDDVVISSQKLNHAIDFKPRYNLREGLVRTKAIFEKEAAS